MKEAYEAIAKDFGEEKVVAMQQVAKDLLNGDQVEMPAYAAVKKKKFGLF